MSAVLTGPGTIPAELLDLPQWVTWRMELADGKPTKVPYSPATGHKASTTDPGTWGSYEQAVWAAASRGHAGVGFVFSADDPYVGVDLDHCRDPDTGAVEAWALEIVRRLDSYTEVSQSGTGLHIIVRGELPPRGRKKGPIEMYMSGRFFCMTGRVLEPPS